MGFRQRFFAVMATVAMVASACSGGSSAPVDPNAPDIRNVTLTSVTSGINPALDGFSFPNFAAASVGEDFNTDDMAHKIPRCIEWVSGIHELEPGDIIATGTNHRGLSSFQDGDKVELEVEGMGRLTIAVKDDLKRTWSRETRLEREQRGFTGTTPQLTGKYAKA